MVDHSAPLLGRCDFPESGAGLNLAVSGGPDSLAMLALGVASGCSVTAFHVDHGLREGSHLEAQVVEDTARRFGAEFRSLRVEVSPGPNLEARLREARFGVLPAAIATGHTADDQAETILLNLIRGSGIDGLSGMAFGPRHPILRLRRSETHRLCYDLGLNPVIDPTNEDLTIRRNRIRHELMPLLDKIADRDVAELMARQSDLVSQDAALLNELAMQIDPTDATQLGCAPVPLARRAVRMWLAAANRRRYVPDADAVERVLRVARKEVIGCEVGGGISVRRTSGRLRIEKDGDEKWA